MLSRVAERMYWTSRYVERAQNTARMLRAVSHISLDAPHAGPSWWRIVLEILGLEDAYMESVDGIDERQVVRFLLADETNPSSIISCISHARESARTTREILPTEAWEEINDLYWYARDQAAKSVARNSRNRFISDVIGSSQKWNGLLAGTMSHDAAYTFMRLGRNIERADMTTRILDLGAAGEEHIAELASSPDRVGPIANSLWMGVLLCLSAYQMYHQHVQTRVSGPDVVRFLLADEYFPRSVLYCLTEVKSWLGRMPRHELPQSTTVDILAQVQRAQSRRFARRGLPQYRRYIDNIQERLGRLHQHTAQCWFNVQTTA